MNTYIFPGAELPTMPLGSVVCICFVFPRSHPCLVCLMLKNGTVFLRVCNIIKLAKVAFHARLSGLLGGLRGERTDSECHETWLYTPQTIDSVHPKPSEDGVIVFRSGGIWKTGKALE